MGGDGRRFLWAFSLWLRSAFLERCKGGASERVGEHGVWYVSGKGTSLVVRSLLLCSLLFSSLLLRSSALALAQAFVL